MIEDKIVEAMLQTKLIHNSQVNLSSKQLKYSKQHVEVSKELCGDDFAYYKQDCKSFIIASG